MICKRCKKGFSRESEPELNVKFAPMLRDLLLESTRAYGGPGRLCDDCLNAVAQRAVQDHDAQAKMSLSYDGKFIRTCVMVDEGTTTSIDIVVMKDGGATGVLCRINLAAYERPGLIVQGNVDVIDIGKQHKLRALTWREGEPVLNFTLPEPANLVSVELTAKSPDRGD